jgi:hypothetical protein
MTHLDSYAPRAVSYVLCGPGCWSSGCFPNKVEFTPHQSKGCRDEGCPWDACYTPDRETMARVLRGFAAHGPQEDIAHLVQNVRILLQNPDMMLFGVSGEVPAENPWAPMRTRG